MIEVIGAPFDLGGGTMGSRLGPIALRLEGLIPGLERIGQEVIDTGAVTNVDGLDPSKLEDRHALANEVFREIKSRVYKSLSQSHTPVVVGGDHSIAIGSISGALQQFGDGLAVLWIDAHMDLNTPDESPSGNLHGMPLAALSGLTSKAGGELGKEWSILLDDIVGEPKLSSDRIAWLGLRDVDKGEVGNLPRIGGSLALTMKEVDALGVAGAMAEIDTYLRNNEIKALWVSFDADSLDPLYAPGTGTAVRGGFTYREGHLIAETLYEWSQSAPYKIAGLDVVEVNPLIDHNNETANVAMEWTLSFFGKSILHPEDPGRTER